MNRTTAKLAAMLLLGAGLMYVASNFRFRVESVAAPEPTPARPAPAPRDRGEPAPALLPESVRGPRAGQPVPADDAVRPASLDTAVGALNRASATAPTLAVTSVTETPDAPFLPAAARQVVRWAAPAANTPPIYLLTRKPTVNLPASTVTRIEVASDVNPRLKFVANAPPVQPNNLLAAVAQPPLANTAALPIDFTAAPLDAVGGPVTVTINADNAGTITQYAVKFRVPQPRGTDPVTVTAYQNSRYTDFPLITAVPASGRFELFGGSPAHLELKGQLTGPPANVQFVGQEDGKPVFGVTAEPVGAQAGTDWRVRLTNLPAIAPGTNGFVAVRTVTGDDHYYAANLAAFTAAAGASPLKTPQVVVTKADDAAVPSDAGPAGITTYYANTLDLKVTVKGASLDANAKGVLLYVDSLDPTHSLAATPGTDAAFTVRLTTGREHSIKAAVVRGGVVSPPATVDVRVVTQGPRVEGVFAPAFGTGASGEQIVVKFSPGSQLDPKKAQNPANYTVTHNQTKADVPVTAVVYDPVADTVTLSVGKVEPGSVTVTVVRRLVKDKKDLEPDGLFDVYGNPPVQAPGAADAVYFLATLFTQTLDQLAPPTAGVTLTPGPRVEFPTYLPTPTYPSGFNPGDHVETRVARLYYYRDAHRVAMIINRSVKSYAAAAVEVRQRQADRARDTADTSREERRRLEGRAVRAAQDARAAEAELAAAQARTGTARTESAQAGIQINQKQLELDQANRDLAAAQAQVEFQIANDTVVVTATDLLSTATRAATANPNDVNLRLAQTNAQTNLDRTLALTRNRVTTETAATLDAMRRTVAKLGQDIQTLRQVASTGDTVAGASPAEITRLQQKVQTARAGELDATASWQAKELEEQRLRTNQFRLDVAAATADPNTYAPAKVDSNDPVMQVSVSVIGEGVIQLRGPIHGVNTIRRMINQIDAPVGQVRISVHTVQVNGERGDRMEKVTANIQRYIDHSRFLTANAAQMLRKSVTAVAGRKAAEVEAELGPACTQEARDRKYLHAFFGKDFIDELTLLDSEFLKTGNKVLSLHSMDSTSLSSALFLMALAKNEVRREILAEFMGQMQTQLPAAEWNYYLAGLSGNKCEACCDKKHYLLAYNAKFQSFLGFFDGEVQGTDTLNPIQREMIRLAQIFKAQMVTEITLKQRYLERSLVEERIGGDYIGELRKAKRLEDEAKGELQKIQNRLLDATAKSAQAVSDLQGILDDIENTVNKFVGAGGIFTYEQEPGQRAISRYGLHPVKLAAKERLRSDEPTTVLSFRAEDALPADPKSVEAAAATTRANLDEAAQFLARFYYSEGTNYDRFKRVQELIGFATTGSMKLTQGEYEELKAKLPATLKLIKEEATLARQELDSIVGLLASDRPDFQRVASRYRAFRETIRNKIRAGEKLDLRTKSAFDAADAAMRDLATGAVGYQAALRKAQLARRPLDEKKLLDLLTDDTEDKYIEQLEGTRAHTANVDNYIKAVSTALDDDFNTQFYLPAFRKVREASRLWDVTLGQVETTTVLTNNRQFAKVSPAATMEFDLPKRDIMITEGFRSAKALFDEYGALMNDPTFLALGKLYSGMPSTGQFNTGGGVSAVRNVLPGLGGSPDEMVLAQAGPGRKEFGAALEGLIPDPAIYKFETGTGFEIRPVLAPDGQAVVFNFNYLYTTDVREPVRADEKHLGRVKRHFVNTDVQLSNYELREVSKYVVGLKAARTAKGVPLLQDIPGLGLLFRPLPSAESSLQENLIYSQATIFPTLFDLMGLRYAQAVADLDPLATRVAEFAARGREMDIMQRTADIGATRVDDEGLRTPFGERRKDLYRSQFSWPYVHPNGYVGDGLRQKDSTLMEGPGQPYAPQQAFPTSRYAPYQTWESASKPLAPQEYMPRPPGGTPPPGFYDVPAFGPGGPIPGPPLVPVVPPAVTDPRIPPANGGSMRGVPPPATIPGHPDYARTAPPPGGAGVPGSTVITPGFPPNRLPTPAPVGTPFPGAGGPAPRPFGGGTLPPVSATPGVPTYREPPAGLSPLPALPAPTTGPGAR